MPFLHGHERVATDADGRALDGSGYRAFLGIAPLAVRTARDPAVAPADWNKVARSIGDDEGIVRSNPGIAGLVQRLRILGFGESLAIARRFVAGHGEDCLGAVPAQADEVEYWCVKEGASSAVWRVTAPQCRPVAVNVARDRLASADLEASARHLAALAEDLPEGTVATPLSSAWIDDVFVLAQAWLDDAEELGVVKDPLLGRSALARIAHFLPAADGGASQAAGRVWRDTDEEQAVVEALAALACAAARAGLAHGLGAAELILSHGDLVWCGRPAIVACGGQAGGASMPGAAQLTDNLLAETDADERLRGLIEAAFAQSLQEPGDAGPATRQSDELVG